MQQLSFNPHPTRRPGATSQSPYNDTNTGVSILTRPEGRVLHQDRRYAFLQAWFQSSPDPKAGCYWTSSPYAYETISFNPHPTRRPGATLESIAGRRTLTVSILTRPEGRVLQKITARTPARVGFNPHPTRRPGATPPPHNPHCTKGVSILTRPEGRVLPTGHTILTNKQGVSILTRPEGRVLHHSAQCPYRP